MRYIIIDLSSDNDLEQPNLFGGYEGEHNESILQVKLPKRMIDIECSGYRFDFQTSEDNKISSPLIPVSELNNDILSFHLTQQLTIAGKLLFNVVAILSDENTVSMISKTNTVVLHIENAADGNIQLLDPNGYKDELQKMVDERIKEINPAKVDQTYIPDSEKAQSGKAVAEAINNKVPKVAERGNLYPKALAVKSMPELENIDGILYPKNSDYKHLNIDDGYSKEFPAPSPPDVSITKGFIATRDELTGNLWTGIPVDDVDCANKKYVDEKADNYYTKTEVDEKTIVDQTYNSNSLNAQSGKAVAEAENRIAATFSNQINEVIGKIHTLENNTLPTNYYTKTEVDEKTVVDQTYNAESENAQSGKAVAQVINSRIPKVAESDVMSYPKAVVSISDLEMIDGKTYPKDTAYKHLNIDDGYSKDFPTTPDVSLTKGFIATRDESTGNLWTGIPVDDVDCANKKYVDDKISAIPICDYRLVAEVTLEEDVNQIYISTDTDGNTFSLKEMYVVISGSVSSSNKSIYYGIDKTIHVLYNTILETANSTTVIDFKKVSNDKCLVLGSACNRQGGYVYNGKIITGVLNTGDIRCFYAETFNSETTFTTGTKIEIWGVDNESI